HAPPIAIRGEREGILLEIAMEWTDSYHETMLCFTNNIPQRDGGTHLAGFRGALTRTVNAYANDSGLAKTEKVALTGEDMRAGLARAGSSLSRVTAPAAAQSRAATGPFRRSCR